MIAAQELAQALGNLLQDGLSTKNFLDKKEEVRSIARSAGGTLDSYEEEGSTFAVRISRVHGWGSDALYSRKFSLGGDTAIAAE